MTNDAALRYQQAAARGASPLGQIVALYDTILRDFLRAQAALKAGDVEARVFELNHALSIIGYLQSVLDYEHGGDAARHFERLYKISVGMIVTANTEASPKALDQLTEMFGGLRQAWYEADQKLAANEARVTAISAPPDAAGKATTSPTRLGVDAPQRHWST
jgi:flagellar secretion chaperone FliS